MRIGAGTSQVGEGPLDLHNTDRSAATFRKSTSSVANVVRERRQDFIGSSPGADYKLMMDKRNSLADHVVPVAIMHVWMCRMAAMHRRDPVPPRFLARIAAVTVVVVHAQGIVAGGFVPVRHRGWPRRARLRFHVRTVAVGEYPLDDCRLTSVNGEIVGSANFHYTGREPAAVVRRQPFGSLLATFLVAIHGRGRQRQVADRRQNGRGLSNPSRIVQSRACGSLPQSARCPSDMSKQSKCPLTARTHFPSDVQCPARWAAGLDSPACFRTANSGSPKLAAGRAKSR